MVVSQHKGSPNFRPQNTMYTPSYYRNPQKGCPQFWETPIIFRNLFTKAAIARPTPWVLRSGPHFFPVYPLFSFSQGEHAKLTKWLKIPHMNSQQAKTTWNLHTSLRCFSQDISVRCKGVQQFRLGSPTAQFPKEYSSEDPKIRPAPKPKPFLTYGTSNKLTIIERETRALLGTVCSASPLKL